MSGQGDASDMSVRDWFSNKSPMWGDAPITMYFEQGAANGHPTASVGNDADQETATYAVLDGLGKGWFSDTADGSTPSGSCGCSTSSNSDNKGVSTQNKLMFVTILVVLVFVIMSHRYLAKMAEKK